MKKIKISNVWIFCVLLFIYLPIFLVILYSFNESRLSSVWGGFSLTWYQALFKNRSLFSALKNSLILALNTSLLSAVIGTLGAYGMHFSKHKKFEFVAILPMLIPEIILGMVFLAFFSDLHLPFGMVTLTLAHTGLCFPFVYMLVKSRLKDMDESMMEAAYTLGAGPVRTFFDIVLPYIMPSIFAGMLLSFATSMDDVILSGFVSGISTNTLPVKIYSQLKTGVTPEINALCTLMILVTLLLFGLAKWIIMSKKKENI